MHEPKSNRSLLQKVESWELITKEKSLEERGGGVRESERRS